MDENLHAQMLDEQLKKLRAELAEKERREKEKKVGTASLVNFVEKQGIRVNKTPLEKFNMPLFAIIYGLISLKPADRKLKAMREDVTLMKALRGALNKMGPAATMPLPPASDALSFPKELTDFLGKILTYLARAYPPDLMDFLVIHEKFFFALLRNSKEWRKVGFVVDEDDPSTFTISHALHQLVLHDMEKGAFGAKKFLVMLIEFLEALSPSEAVPNDAILCSMSLALQASRSLLREFQGRSVKPEKEFFISKEDLPASLISKPTMERIMKILSSPSSQAAGGVILPFLLLMAKLDYHCVSSGIPPTVAPAFYALEGEQGLLYKLASAWPSSKPPKDVIYLHGTCGNFPLMYTELWAHVFRSMHAGKLSISNRAEPTMLVPILSYCVTRFCDPSTSAALRTQAVSFFRSFLPLGNAALLDKILLTRVLKMVLKDPTKKEFPQAVQVLNALLEQKWLDPAMRTELSKYQADFEGIRLKREIDGTMLATQGKNEATQHIDQQMAVVQGGLTKSGSALQLEAAETQTVADTANKDKEIQDIEAKLAALQEAKKSKLRAVFDQIQFHLLTPEMLQGKDGEYMKKNVNFVDDKGRTMLHIACMAGNKEAALFLVAVPEINKVAFDHSGNSPRQCTTISFLIDLLNKNGIA